MKFGEKHFNFLTTLSDLVLVSIVSISEVAPAWHHAISSSNADLYNYSPFRSFGVYEWILWWCVYSLMQPSEFNYLLLLVECIPYLNFFPLFTDVPLKRLIQSGQRSVTWSCISQVGDRSAPGTYWPATSRYH